MKKKCKSCRMIKDITALKSMIIALQDDSMENARNRKSKSEKKMRKR